MQQRLVQGIYAVLCITISTVLITIGIQFWFERILRSRFDLRNRYVPESATRPELDALNSMRTTRPNTEACIAQVITGRPTGTSISDDEFTEMREALRQNCQACCFLSCVISHRIRYDTHEPFEGFDDTDSADSVVMPDIQFEMAAEPVDHVRRFSQYVLDDINNDAPTQETTSNEVGETSARVPEQKITFQSLPREDTTASPRSVASVNPCLLSPTVQMYDVDRGFVSAGFGSDERAHRAQILRVRHELASNPVVLALSTTVKEEFDYKDPFFARCHTNPIVYRLWSSEAHRCGWRLAIEAVKMAEYALAEALFEMAMLIDDPDMFYVLHTDPRHPQVLLDALDVVVAQSISEDLSATRAWAQFYAAVLMDVDVASYNARWSQCRAPTPALIVALLGLEQSASYQRFGAVDYSLHIETEVRLPTVNAAMSRVQTSLVTAAHMFRLCSPSHGPCGVWHRTKEEAYKAGSCASEDLRMTLKVYLDSLSVENSTRDVHHEVRYAPYTEPSRLAMSWVLPQNAKERLTAEDSCHNNFRATIEFGRLCAMFACRDQSGMPMHTFGDTYLREEREIRECGHRYALAPHPFSGWKSGAIDRGCFRPADVEDGNNHYPLRIPPITTNPYLTYWTNWRVGGYERVRFACPHPNVRLGLSALSRFKPARCQGTGSLLSPHCSWTTVEDSLRIGDIIFLHPGRYSALTLHNVKGAPQYPIIFAPVSKYGQGFSYSASRIDDRESMEPNNEETAKVKPVVTAPDVFLCGKDGDSAVVNLIRSTDIRICDVELTGQGETHIGVSVYYCDRVFFEKCVVDTEIACQHNGCENEPCPPENNTFTQVQHSTLFRKLLGRILPSSFLLVAYPFTFGLYIAFILLVLFSTAAMTQKETDEWVKRCVTTIVIKVFLVSPVLICSRLAVEVGRSLTTLDVSSIEIDFS